MVKDEDSVSGVQTPGYNHTFFVRRIWIESVVVSVAPHIHCHKVTDVRWNFAFHYSSVSSNDVFLISVDLIILNYSFSIQFKRKTKSNWCLIINVIEMIMIEIIEENAFGMLELFVWQLLPSWKFPPPKISSSSPLIHATTWTKSATKLGIKHLIMAEFPLITYSLGVISASYTWLITIGLGKCYNKKRVKLGFWLKGRKGKGCSSVRLRKIFYPGRNHLLEHILLLHCPPTRQRGQNRQQTKGWSILLSLNYRALRTPLLSPHHRIALQLRRG